MELCSKVMPCCGILVVKDPPGASPSSPGILGMNVIRRCYQELFGVFGSSLFESPSVSGTPGPVVATLQKCHQMAAQPTSNPQGDVRVCAGQVVWIPGGEINLVAATTSEKSSGQGILFEPPPSQGCQLGCWLPHACYGLSVALCGYQLSMLEKQGFSFTPWSDSVL